MSKLIGIQSQIADLQKQAEIIKSREFATTVQDIKEKMAAFGITIKDLKEPLKANAGRKSLAKTEKKAKSTNGPKAKVEIKYAGQNGEAWTGRGLMPKWLKALTIEGHSKDEFLVKKPADIESMAA